jgi:hypothetical protein
MYEKDSRTMFRRVLLVALLLTGRPVMAQISVSPSSLSFPDTAVGQSSAPLSVTVTSSPQRFIRSINLSGSNPGDFSQTNDCRRVISSCTVSVIFTPTATGARSANLNVGVGVRTPLTVALSGTGLTGGAVLSLVRAVACCGGSGTNKYGSNPVSDGNQHCTWTLPQAIAPGDALVGFAHSTNNNDQFPMAPQSVTDNAGNIYNLTPAVTWIPFPEPINVFWLTNIQGSPTSITMDFSQYPNSGNTVLGTCDEGFAEYSGATSIVVAGPNSIPAPNNSASITVSPTAPALIWAFAANFGGDAFSFLQTSGYTGLIDEFMQKDIGVWGSNSAVPAGAVTLTWNIPEGNSNPCNDSSMNGCPPVLAAVAVQ